MLSLRRAVVRYPVLQQLLLQTTNSSSIVPNQVFDNMNRLAVLAQQLQAGKSLGPDSFAKVAISSLDLIDLI